MSTITLTLNLNEVSESALAEALRILKGGDKAAPAAAVIPAPAKKPKAETSAPGAEEVKAEGLKKEEPVKVTIEQIRAVVAAKKDNKREEIKALLTKHGADSVTNLDPAKYKAFFTDLEAL